MIVESCVFSITDYGAEVIGYNQHSATEAIYIRTLRSYLGLNKYTPSQGLKAEFQWLSSRSRCQIRMVRQFLRIRNLPNSRITKKVFNYDLNFSNMGNENCLSTEVNKMLNINCLGHNFTLKLLQ